MVPKTVPGKSLGMGNIGIEAKVPRTEESGNIFRVGFWDEK